MHGVQEVVEEVLAIGSSIGSAISRSASSPPVARSASWNVRGASIAGVLPENPGSRSPARAASTENPFGCSESAICAGRRRRATSRSRCPGRRRSASACRRRTARTRRDPRERVRPDAHELVVDDVERDRDVRAVPRAAQRDRAIGRGADPRGDRRPFQSSSRPSIDSSAVDMLSQRSDVRARRVGDRRWRRASSRVGALTGWAAAMTAAWDARAVLRRTRRAVRAQDGVSSRAKLLQRNVSPPGHVLTGGAR